MGNRTRVKVVKNKMAPPFREAEFEIRFGKGIFRAGEVLDCAVDRGVVQRAGSWFSLNGERLGQGREKVIAHMEETPGLMEQICGTLLPVPATPKVA